MKNKEYKESSQLFYRYILRYRLDEIGTHFATVELQVFESVKRTKCGRWIRPGSQMFEPFNKEHRWVSDTARKRYAYPTQIEALNGLILRTERRVEILEELLMMCKEGLKESKNMLVTDL